MDNKEIKDLFSEYSEEELFSHVDHSDLESEKITAPRYSYWRSVFRVFFRNKVNIVILTILAILIAFTYIYPAVSEYDRFANLMNDAAKHLSPMAAIKKFGFSIHWILGTGAAGQPTFDAVWYGSRISLSLALICAAINLTVGVLVGAVWGFSKKIDLVMTEVYNIIGNVPYILLISVLVLLFAPSFWTMVFALTVTGWLAIAYFIRTQVIIIRDREYNLASRCLGTGLGRILFRNIFPYLVSVIILRLALAIPNTIAYETTLTYLGLMDITKPSLGMLLSAARAVFPRASYTLIFPAIIVSIITITFYLVGNAFSDACDPRNHV